MNSAYRERLLPKWWVLVFIASLIAMLSIAYGAAINAQVGWIMFIALASSAGLAMYTSSPVIEVSDVLAVGLARLPLAFIGEVAVLDSTQTREARSRRIDARNFVLVKSWAASQSVFVTLTDPADPHPAWLVSSRHPRELMAAINANSASAG
ncbi:MAG: DUF3093 domain-containing protein [Actinomycetota bacterium]|nr:DUF3093 domain-containing protein [Actinomycetota bacterium]